MNCLICNRRTPEECAERHHLIPRSKDGKETIDVCIDCGNQLHLLFTNKELKKTYNTLEVLLSNDRVQRWIRFINKQTNFGINMKIKKRK
jgi:hypothetical protein